MVEGSQRGKKGGDRTRSGIEGINKEGGGEKGKGRGAYRQRIEAWRHRGHFSPSSTHTRGPCTPHHLAPLHPAARLRQEQRQIFRALRPQGPHPAPTPGGNGAQRGPRVRGWGPPTSDLHADAALDTIGHELELGPVQADRHQANGEGVPGAVTVYHVKSILTFPFSQYL